MRGITLVILLVITMSCGDESTLIGADFFNAGSLDVTYLDSVSVKLSTIKYEDVVTSGSTRLLVGNHDDQKLGSVRSSAYFQLSLPSTNPIDQASDEYNYLVLILKYDGYSYYDTTASNNFFVHRVIEDIELDDDGYLYNYNDFDLESKPLGSNTFAARPHRDDSIAIKLDDEFGLELYNKLISESADLTSSEEFLNYLNGLAVLPDTTTSGSILGFSTDAELRLYYIDKSQVPNRDDQYISFPLSSGSNVFFNRIISKTENTKLHDQLSSGEMKLGSEQTDDESYLQGGTGLGLRVDIPYIKRLRDVKNFYMSRAILDIFAADGTSDDLTPLPEELSTYVIHDDNSASAESSAQIEHSREMEIPRRQYYSVDVTAFIQMQLDDTEGNTKALVFNLDEESYKASVNRLIVDASQTRLRIYYATITNLQ